MMCSYGNQVETSLCSCDHTSTDLGIPIAGELEENENWKTCYSGCKLSFYVMVDREISTHLRNKKQLILIVNKNFKLFQFQME